VEALKTGLLPGCSARSILNVARYSSGPPGTTVVPVVLRVLLRVLGNVLRAPFFPLWWIRRRAPQPRGWLRLRIRRQLAEAPASRPRLLQWLLPGEERPTSLASLRRLADEVTRDARVPGVVVEVPRLSSGWAAAGALRKVLVRIRDAGKGVVVFLPEGGGHRELYVASAASRVLVAQEAIFAPLGLGVEARFLKPLLDRVGLTFQAVARKEYKGAAERFTRESLSGPNREQLEALLRDHGAVLDAALGERGVDPPRLLERGLARSEELVDVGFADREIHVDEVPLHLGEGEVPRSPERLVGAGVYLRRRRWRFFRPVTDPPFFAIVPIRGVIVDQPMGGLFGGVSATSFEVTARILRRLRKDPQVAGVLLEIDSPGGSAFASERIHRELVRLREDKPVVAWMGDVAASGGYYVAMAAEHVVATETTITGSIGVVSGKWAAEDLLARVGVRTETVRLHGQADLFSPSRRLDDEGLGIFDRQADAFYDRFLEVVREGRGLAPDRVEDLARGRVWSGRAAADRGLVDDLGGFDAAVEVLRARAKVPPGQRAAIEARRLSPRELLAVARSHPPPPPPPGTDRVLAAELGRWLDGPASRELFEMLTLLRDGASVLAWLPATPRID